MRKTIWGVALMALATLTHASVSVAPVLVSDDFEAGNTPNAAPAGWKIAAGEGVTVQVVDASVTEPASGSFCVEMRDDSPKGRAELYRSFPPTPAGRASSAFKLDAAATAHSAFQLRSAAGKHLCSLIFANTGVIRYDRDTGNVNTSAAWTPKRWQTIEIEWFKDFTFNAYLDGTQIVDRVPLSTHAVPGQLYVIVGYGAITNRVGYVDDVRVVAGPTE